MNESIQPDDPRLTAYALGELEGEEAALIAAAVAADPALAAVVEDVQAMAGSLEDVFAAEPAPAVTPLDLPRIETETERAKDLGKIVRFPYYWVSGLAAAAFAVLIAVRSTQDQFAPREEVIRYDLDLGEAAQPEVAPMALPAPDFMQQAEKLQREAVEIDDANVVTLSPFEVSADADNQGYTAATTLAGNRLNTELRDVGNAVTVISSQFLTDIAATDNESLLQYTTGTEVGNIQGNFAGIGDGTQPAVQNFYNNPNGNTRVRGLTAASNEPGTTFRVGSYGSASDQADMNRVLVDDQLAVRVAEVRQQAPAVREATFSVRMADPVLMAPPPAPPLATEGYTPIDETGFQRVLDHPLSTFAVEADTASYANVRRFLTSGSLPPADAVRIEELINAFPYDYSPPAAGTDAPFAAHLEVAAAPWAPEHQLVRVGLKGRDLSAADRGPANLVFLLDVSGSMNQPNKLPLVKAALRLLVGQLRADDRVAIVTYAGSSGLALPSTPVSQGGEILASLDNLRAGGSTNGAMGIHLAYDVARANFVAGGVNRVILCTDGDFNVGVTNVGDLGRLVEEKRETGVFLTALGFGMGNYQDDTLEQLANKGNGFYGYIDTEKEARRLLVEQVNGTLAVIAKDVKIQVEFNPARVAAYRLIGYENRRLAAEDFNNDAVDAGEIGAGHTVTALYEIVPTGAELPTIGAVDDLKYQFARPANAMAAAEPDFVNELLTVKVRAKAPDSDESRRWDFPLSAGPANFAGASPDFRFAASVAGFGLVLRDSAFKGTATFAQIVAWAESAIGPDLGGHRREFLQLVRRAEALAGAQG